MRLKTRTFLFIFRNFHNRKNGIVMCYTNPLVKFNRNSAKIVTCVSLCSSLWWLKMLVYNRKMHKAIRGLARRSIVALIKLPLRRFPPTVKILKFNKASFSIAYDHLSFQQQLKELVYFIINEDSCWKELKFTLDPESIRS